MTDELPEFEEADAEALQRSRDVVQTLYDAAEDFEALDRTNLALLDSMLSNVNQAVSAIVIDQAEDD